MNIRNNINTLQRDIPANVKLVVVSKMQPLQSLQEAYNAGIRRFGENKVQELTIKQPQLPKDIEWHFIGHLQTNKVKFIAPFVNVIHSIDSLKLLVEVDKEAMRNNRTIDCLLELYIASEETKYGLDLEEAKSILSSPEFQSLTNTYIIGVMGMATYTDNEDQIHQEFKTLKGYFDILKKEFLHTPTFKEISMGMSGDYKIAIEEGSTMVRLGTAVFR